MHSFLEHLTEMALKDKDWHKGEKGIKKVLSSLGHVQCGQKGGCGHDVDAHVHKVEKDGSTTPVGVSIGQRGKDVAQASITIDENGNWTHSASSEVFNNHLTKIKLAKQLHKKYGSGWKPATIKKGKEKKHATAAAHAISKHGEMKIDVPDSLVGDHQVGHHGAHYHIQRVKTKQGEKALLYRTTKSNPLGIKDKNGKHPPIFSQGASTYIRIRAKEGNRSKKTGYYKTRGVAALKVKEEDVKESPIDLFKAHETIHSSSGIFTSDKDRAKAKTHEKRKK